MAPVFRGLHPYPSSRALPVLARHEAALDRQLHGCEAERLPGHVLLDAVDLEHDPAGLDLGSPELDGALALAHADLGRLLRDRHVREDADPDPALALHVAGQRAAGGLDLAGGQPVGLGRLQAEVAEIELRAALGLAMDAALELLAELGSLRLQHF